MVTFESLISRENKVAVVGLGYVGLPLSVHLFALNRAGTPIDHQGLAGDKIGGLRA